MVERVRQASGAGDAWGQRRGEHTWDWEVGKGPQASRWRSGWEQKQHPLCPGQGRIWGRGPRARLTWLLPSREEAWPRDGACSAE